jgi:methylmalonyl-CoA mutase cobalamin-binding subunit
MATATDLRVKIRALLLQWESQGLPSRDGLVQAADELRRWKEARGIGGLWRQAPLMVTATVDDGFGHGLDIIHRFADAAGMRVAFLGLLQAPRTVVDACRQRRPALLGMTVLQFDSEDAVRHIADHLPPYTRLVAGGPLFAADPDFARRAGIHFAAATAADFLNYLMDLDGNDDKIR